MKWLKLSNSIQLASAPVREELDNMVYDYAMTHYSDIEKLSEFLSTHINQHANKIGDLKIYLKNILTKLDYKRFLKTGGIASCIYALLDSLRDYNFSGDMVDRFVCEDIVKHCLLEFPIDPTEMEKTVKAIAVYCYEREENTYTHFKNYLMKSKIVRQYCNVPLEYLEKKNKEFVETHKEQFEEEGEAEDD